MAKDHTTQGKVSAVVAHEGNGNIQITFTIPFETIKKAQDETIAEMAKDIEVPGFRKGNAPLAKVAEKIPQNQLIEHSLGHIMPAALRTAVEDNKLKIAIYPKFELIKAKPNEPWEIRGVTCELPEVNLGAYKKDVAGKLRSSSIWTPDKGSPDQKKEPTREEKESMVIKTLLESIKIEIPQILIEDEADSRLSKLLARLEKLGLALENYLTSVNKTAQDLRADYAKQAKEAISLDLILNKIAEVEKITVSEKELLEALSVSEATKTSQQDQESKKQLVGSILLRRKALDSLISGT